MLGKFLLGLEISVFLLFVGVVNCEDPSLYINVNDNILNTVPFYNLQHHDDLIEILTHDNNAKKKCENTSCHKSLEPVNGRDIAGFVLAAFALMLAAGGGIGGGGILLPIYTLVMDFTPKYAIPLSNISILGGSVANVLLNLNKRHPLADRPLVDWDLILVMEPLTISGAIIGGIFNKLLPEWLLTLLLVIVLGLTTQRTMQKGIQLYKKENQIIEEQTGTSDLETPILPPKTSSSSLDGENQHQNEIQSGLEMEDEGRLHSLASTHEQQKDSKLTVTHDVPVDGNTDTTHSLLDGSRNQEDRDRLDEILEEERHVSIAKVGAIFVMFIIVIMLNIFKGGGGKPSIVGVKCGTPAFWVIQSLIILWTFICAFFARFYLVRRTKVKEEVNFPYVEGDIVWDGRATIVYPAICSVAGLCAGMFGVGGGIVKGPLMLAMGVHPLVAAATSATMILFTSFTATSSFIEYGLLQYDYAFVLLGIGFVATLIGQTIMNLLIKKTGRMSIVILIIGTVVGLSTILMALQTILTTKQVREGHGTVNSGLCGVGA